MIVNVYIVCTDREKIWEKRKSNNLKKKKKKILVKSQDLVEIV